MATPAQELFDETACFCFPMETAQRLRIAFLLRSVVAVAPATDVTPEALAALGACYCQVGISQADQIELALLNLLSDAL